MQIGELFLNLGVKGSEKTIGAIAGVKKGLSETASLSLEAKAGILGAMYALEQLFSTSGKAGTSLTNFNSLTGESVRTLQQYQYAGRQVGLSNDQVADSFKSLQSAMAKTAYLGEGLPKGMNQVAIALKRNFSQLDIRDFAAHPEKLIQVLQEYAQKEKNVGLRNEVLSSIPGANSIISGLTRNAFRPDVLNKAPTYSDREVNQLDKANIAWSNLGNKIEMAVGHFNAKHGLQLVTDISKITDQVVKLADAFVKLFEQLKVFQGIGKAFEGWTEIFKGVSTGVGELSTDKGRSQLGKDTLEFAKSIPGVGMEVGKDIGSAIKNFSLKLIGNGSSLSSPAQKIPNSVHHLIHSAHDLKSDHISHQVIPSTHGLRGNNTNNQNNNVTINNSFQHPGTDSKRTADSMKQQVNAALRQSKSLTQAN